MDNYYKIIGVEDFCTDQDKIKSAYRQQIKFFHPDLGNVSQEVGEEKTKSLNIAYSVLSDPQKKQIYDSQLRYEQSGTQQTNYYSNKNASSNYSTYSNYYNNNGRNYSNNSSNYNSSNTNRSGSSYYGSNYTNYSNRGSYGYKQNKSSGKLGIFIWILVAICFLAMCDSSGSSSSYSGSSYSGSSGNSSNSSTKSDLDANLTPVSVSNGQILKSPSDERIAPLEVKTSGSGGYYIYLKDKSNGGKNDIAFYVKGGKTCEIDVPLGNYEFYYCSGETWYGKSHKFGSNTVYSKADKTFKFYVEGDNVWGHTVTLYSVTNGNLETKNINEGQFPG